MAKYLSLIHISRTLAARGGDGQHRAHGQGLFDGYAALVEIPEIPIVQGARGDGLGRIDGGAAAHGQDEIHTLFAAERDALAHQAAAGVGLDAAQGDKTDARGLERSQMFIRDSCRAG